MKKENKTKQIEKSRSFDFRNKWTSGILLILLATFLLFSPAIQYDFVNWDDPVNVFENKNVTEFDIKEIFSNPVIGGYNPLTILTFAIDYKISGGKPWIFHLNNIILHLLCTFLVFTLLRKLEFSFFVTFLVTLLFGLHPLRVESVVWITERKDVLFGFFFLLSLIFYTDYTKTNKKFLYIISLLLFILSLLSKIQAVALPLVLFLIDYLLVKKTNLKSILEKIPFFILSLFTGILGIYFLRKQGSLDSGEVFSFTQRILIGSYSFMLFIIKSLIPYNLSALHPYVKNLTLVYYLSLIPTLAIFAFPFFTFNNRKVLTFGILFFIFNIIFLLQVLGAGQGFLAERFTYIPYIGLFLIYASFIEYILSRFRNKQIPIYFSLAIYFIIISIITINQIKTWKNTTTLWQNVIEVYPTSSLAYNNLGHYFRKNNDYPKALENYNNAIRYDSKNALAFNNRGKIYFDQGKIDLALQDYNTSLSINPDNAEAIANRGATFALKKDWEKALEDLNRALEIDKTQTNALANRGFVYFQLGKFQKNIDDYIRYLQLKPNDPDIINSIGLCYLNLNQYDNAILEFGKAIQIKPNQSVFYLNRSVAKKMKGDKKGALNDALQSKKLGYNVTDEYLKSI